MLQNVDKNTPTAKGVRSVLQAIAGFMIGLVVTVWAVPGVPEAVKDYMLNNGVSLLLVLGFSSAVVTGLVSFIQNKVEDRSK